MTITEKLREWGIDPSASMCREFPDLRCMSGHNIGDCPFNVYDGCRLSCAGYTISHLIDLLERAEGMLNEACQLLETLDEDRVTAIMHELGHTDCDHWGPMYNSEAWRALITANYEQRKSQSRPANRPTEQEAVRDDNKEAQG